MRVIQDADLKGKIVLIRVDLNVPIVDGVVRGHIRINRILPTVKHALFCGAKVVLMSHLGRPNGADHSLSLSKLLLPLNELLPSRVSFVGDCIGNSVHEALGEIGYGETLLLENLRFHKEETKNDLEFARKLSSIANLYINDAFSCSHRAHASIVAITKFLPSYAGFELQNEIMHLKNFFKKISDSSVAIIGGSKVSTKIDTLVSLVSKVNTLVIGGAMANNFLLTSGLGVGRSLVEAGVYESCMQVLNMAKQYNCRIILPTDAVVAHNINSRMALVKNISDMAQSEAIFDIGPDTTDKINGILLLAKSVLWNGPLGAFEHSQFLRGTQSVAKTVAQLTKESGMDSIVGGGDTLSAIEASDVEFDDFSYVSTGGGAFLEWISNERLSGLIALE